MTELRTCSVSTRYLKILMFFLTVQTKCKWFHPPANEIYRKDEISVFEVDGAVNKVDPCLACFWWLWPLSILFSSLLLINLDAV